MALGASQVSIINLALGHIAQKPIQSTTEGSVQSLAALIVWESAIRETLRSHDWAFATIVEPLALIAAATYTPYGYDYAYMYPSRCVGLWHIYNEYTKDKTVGEDFRELYDKINNINVIVTNCSDAYAEYTYWVSDTTLFDANFITALGYRLAADLAISLVGDQNLAKQMVVLFNNAISEAERMSGYENNTTTKQTSSFLDARG